MGWTFSRGACGAEATDDEFAFAHNALAERACSGAGNRVVFDVFDFTAAVADEVMVLDIPGVEARGAAFDGDFTDETSLNEVAEVVVGGGARRSRIDAVDGFGDFGGGRMTGVFKKKGHHAVTLRSASQTAVFESLPNRVGVHRDLDYV